VLKLRHARITVIVRIIDHGNGLNILAAQSLVFELQRAVRQPAKPVIEILIHRAREDQFVEIYLINNIAVIALQVDCNVWMVQHVLEHARVAVPGHCLKFVRELAVVAVGSYRNTGRH
jgi:hypothetical protein